MPQTLDNAPSVPFDLDAMARIAEDAGRSAVADHEDADPGAPVRAATVRAWAPITAVSRLWRAAYRGALEPGTD